MTASWRSAVGVVAICAIALALPACGEEIEVRAAPASAEESRWLVHEDATWGYSVRFPRSWERARDPVSPRLTDPREILALGTFPLRHRPTNCEAFAGAARSAMGRSDAVVTVQERGHDARSSWPDFPPRPESFAAAIEAQPAESGCGDPAGAIVHWLNFTDAGRHFHALVVFGPETPAAVRDEAWRILDSLRLDPERRPDWPATG